MSSTGHGSGWRGRVLGDTLYQERQREISQSPRQTRRSKQLFAQHQACIDRYGLFSQIAITAQANALEYHFRLPRRHCEI